MTLLWAFLLTTSQAWAKPASIEWGDIPGAAAYEVEVSQEGTGPKIHRVSKTEWKGDLSPGLYHYRIRGVDRFKRPGQWSAKLPLVLMPPRAVELDSPPRGAEVGYFGAQPLLSLKWKPQEGVQRYRVQLWKDGRILKDEKVAGMELKLAGLPDGEFKWKVSGWLEDSQRAPASGRSKHWETESSAEWTFEQKKKQLAAPEVKFPKGLVPTPKNNKLQVQWSTVEGATEYEVKIWKVTERNANKNGRELAQANDLSVKTYRVKQTEMVAPVQGDGAYRVQVRALASMNLPAVEGPPVVQNFALSQHALYSEGSGYVALSTILAPYTYRYASPINGGTASASALSMVGRISGEYWFSSMWGMGGAAELLFFRINPRSFLGKVFELNGKMRINFGKDKWGWILQPRVGLEMRDYFAVSPTDLSNPSSADNRTSIFGPSLGFDIRKQIWEKFSLSLKVNYFIPLVVVETISTTPLNTFHAASFRNVSLGLQGAYWLGGNFGLAAGAIMELRSLGASVASSPGGSPEQIYMDGVFFFGSLIYSFGR